MLDYAGLSPEALDYFRSLPLADQIAINHSNLTFRSLEDLKSYPGAGLQGTGGVLYQTLPEPAVPSNSALDPLDSQ